jgi:hypothetical protein
MRQVFPQQQTSLRSVATSAKCHEQTCRAIVKAGCAPDVKLPTRSYANDRASDISSLLRMRQGL